jgi:8-oxo-dGTP pyrophosphatase MutT (NUDIX family)
MLPGVATPNAPDAPDDAPGPPRPPEAGAVRAVRSRIVYANPWMSVREDDVVPVDGADDAPTRMWGVVDKTEFAVVVAEQDGWFHLVQQYRYPLGRRSWEFPMGTWPAGRTGPTPDLARAELAEETGLTATRWRELGPVTPAGGFCSQVGTVFHATGLVPGPPRREASEQDMVTTAVSERTLREMVADGRITDGITLAAYLVFRLRGAAGDPVGG